MIEPGPPPGNRTTTFFDDAMVDHLLRAVVTLTSELSVTRERLDTLERHLQATQGLTPDTLDRFAFDADAEKTRAARRSALLAGILGPLAEALERTS